jgi:hypothetical protein
MSDILNKLKTRLAEVKKEFAINLASEEVGSTRLDICLNCEYLVKVTRQCSKCFCIVDAKVRLENAKCPKGKW